MVTPLDSPVNYVNLEKNTIIQSNGIICPECKGLCKCEIKNYRIKLYECKNRHAYENIKLNEFKDTQKIDLSKIKCGNCKIKINLRQLKMIFIYVKNVK